MISGKQVLVAGGQFIQHNQISVVHKGSSVDPFHRKSRFVTDKQIAPIDILAEAVAPNALHDSGASFDKPKCHPRTRVKVREIIMRWILGDDKNGQETGKQFMWLNGAAGCGKSAIAQSTVESCIEQGLPLASFFFSKSDSTRNHTGPLVATLAYQLYCAFRGTEVQKNILSAIEEDPLIFKKTLQKQFTSLIIQPLMTHFSKNQSSQHQVPFLIVIDGLDECPDCNAQKAILTGLTESLRSSNLPIPIFVASRPEQDIKLSFSSKYLKDIHTPLSLDIREARDDANSDIELYLFDRFAEIKDDFDNRTTGRKLARDWPGDEIIETLVRKSSQQFIYAATVIRYVESTHHPFAELDSLYAMILESALDMEKVLHVLSLHLVDLDICCPIIEKLLSYDESEVETLFCDMGALVQVYKHKDQIYLRFLHASFREYLVDAARSKQFYIDMDYETIRHVIHALQYLASCCSSSFDPDSIAGEMQSQMAQRMGQITISRELGQVVLSFPLKEFLEPHTSTRTYWELLQFFITPFLELMEAMVITDPTLSYIQDHQLGILRSVLIHQIQRYFNDDWQTLVLVLFYHLGSHRFVPVVYKEIPACYSTLFYPVLGDFHEIDVLSLSCIWEFRNNPYYHFVGQLVCDTLASQTVEYTLGSIMHARAALACFKELARWAPPPPLSSGKNIDIALITDNTADDATSELRLNSDYDSPNCGQWQFTYYDLCDGPYGKELCFLLVGYLIFLLPQCGRSDTLVAACKDYTWLPDDPFQSDNPFQQEAEESLLQYLYDRFPVRRGLFHEEMNNYLARVSPNSISEPCI
ncbi:hypothetical protein CPC08DRAFT_730230 [Agrocybe pediades]|nr:hypothetical protein CPC08DRAFT_730230 [Agrocybe pediades]